MTMLEKKRWLMSILSNRKRWEADGKKQYGYGNDQQMIYDGYHESIYPSAEDPFIYNFYIQVYDSPDGDTWWFGKCRFLRGDTDVEILEEGSDHR